MPGFLRGKKLYIALAVLALVGGIIFTAFQWGGESEKKAQAEEKTDRARANADAAAQTAKDQQKAAEKREAIGAKDEKRKQAIEESDADQRTISDPVYRVMYGP